MKTLKELNQILEENRLLLKDMMIDYCIGNPEENAYLYIDINTGETSITGIKEYSDTEIYVDYFEGFDFDDEITTAMCLVNELELVEKYGIEKEYEEAREDLENSNYAFGDFLCEVGKLGEFKDEVLKEIEEDYYIADISEEEYFKTLKRLEDK